MVPWQQVGSPPPPPGIIRARSSKAPTGLTSRLIWRLKGESKVLPIGWGLSCDAFVILQPAEGCLFSRPAGFSSLREPHPPFSTWPLDDEHATQGASAWKNHVRSLSESQPRQRLPTSTHIPEPPAQAGTGGQAAAVLPKTSLAPPVASSPSRAPPCPGSPPCASCSRSQAFRRRTATAAAKGRQLPRVKEKRALLGTRPWGRRHPPRQRLLSRDQYVPA